MSTALLVALLVTVSNSVPEKIATVPELRACQSEAIGIKAAFVTLSARRNDIITGAKAVEVRQKAIDKWYGALPKIGGVAVANDRERAAFNTELEAVIKLKTAMQKQYDLFMVDSDEHNARADAYVKTCSALLTSKANLLAVCSNSTDEFCALFK